MNDNLLLILVGFMLGTFFGDFLGTYFERRKYKTAFAICPKCKSPECSTVGWMNLEDKTEAMTGACPNCGIAFQYRTVIEKSSSNASKNKKRT